MYDFVIDQESYKYLYVQRGSIAHIKDFENWRRAYNKSTWEQYTDIIPHIPSSCSSSLDIGSGLGGIDVLLSKHYGTGCKVELLDGEHYDAVVKRHNQPFSNHAVMRNFLEANGVSNYAISSPETAGPKIHDLIISMSAYCFHIHPDTYIDLVRKSCDRKTICIFRVRKESGYLDYLRQHFRDVYVIKEEKKGDLICLKNMAL